MRKKIIAANWKMNMTVAETQNFLDAFRREVEEVILPSRLSSRHPFTALSEIVGAPRRLAEDSPRSAELLLRKIWRLHWRDQRRPCFESSSSKYVIVGHSERRQIFGETDSIINKKVLAAHANELKPILCVGETLDEREAGSEKQVLETQLRGGLAGVSPEQLSRDRRSPTSRSGPSEPERRRPPPKRRTPTRTSARCSKNSRTDATAGKVRIQYGGSVKPANATELLGPAGYRRSRWWVARASKSAALPRSSKGQPNRVGATSRRTCGRTSAPTQNRQIICSNRTVMRGHCCISKSRRHAQRSPS